MKPLDEGRAGHWERLTAGLFLGGASTTVRGTPWANMEALVEGLGYYREKGRQ